LDIVHGKKSVKGIGEVNRRAMDFKKAKNKAQRIAGNREKLMALAKAVLLKLQTTEDRHELISKAKTKLHTLGRMVKAYVRGDYKDIPWKSIVLVTAGLIYFVNPFDVVPDFIPVAGMLDDAALILWIFATVAKDVEAFEEWEEDTTSTSTSFE
jgi:uncharacterized membrane protein YkvA (DUF1232 family)